MRHLAKALGLAIALAGPLAFQGSAAADDRNHVLCYTSFDADYFYIAATVTKPSLQGTQSAPFSDPRQDDSVAVYLQSESSPAGAKRSDESVEMVVSAAGGAQLYRKAGATPLQSFADFLQLPNKERAVFKYAVTHRGDLNRPGGADTAYTVEMAIPWVEIGAAPTAGTRMRFNVVARSAAPGSPSILSLSPEVKTADDLESPAKWGEVVFTDAPVKTVASAPEAHVSARVFSAKPLIDGSVTEGEWQSVTAFSMTAAGPTEGPDNAAPSTELPRFRPHVDLKPARPGMPLPMPPFPERPNLLKPHVQQSFPRMVFSLYQYDVQADTRKGLPLLAAISQSGASLIADHPLSGAGPWMTYDSLDWHIQQFGELRRAGIDVVLPVYRAGDADQARYARRGLMALTGALRHMARTGQDYPLLALYLDTASLAPNGTEQIDLTHAAGQEQLYAAIKSFFLTVPPAFRAGVALDAANGGGTANIVVLSSAAPFSAMDATFTEYLRRRFAADFGSDLLLLGNSDFKGKAPLDGYVNDTQGRTFEANSDALVKTACFGPGYDATLGGVAADRLQSRQDGEAYRASWKKAIAAAPDWVFIDGWNDFAVGAEIAPSMEYGLTFVDLTRVFTRTFAGTGTLRASFVSNTLPTAALAGSVYNGAVRVMNAGSTIWTPDGYALVCRWGANGKELRVPLPSAVPPGEAATVALPLPIPAEAGDHDLHIDIAQLGKKGDVTALLGSLGSTPLTTRVHVATAADASLPALAATLISTNTPTTMEVGGTYTVSVTVRNDGADTWKKEGGKLAGRLFRYTPNHAATGEKEAALPVEIADASADLPADVAPGQTVTVSVPITFARSDAAPIAAWSESDDWVYQIAWQYSADESGKTGALTTPETVALIGADIGVQFTSAAPLREMPAEHRIPVRLSIRNNGPQTWRKSATRVGYHWYYLDGTEAVWEDETTPISQDVAPGATVQDMIAWVTAPPFDGQYWLVWDLKLGDTWASTLPSVRANETLVRSIQVTKGRLTFADLSKAYNLDGIAGYAERADSDMDGAGHSLPAELTPPYVSADTAPSGIWLPTRGTGLDSPRRISFKWGPKGYKDKNVVQCLGQRIPLADNKHAAGCKRVHLLAASTGKSVTAAFTLEFSDGSQQYTSFPISAWDAAPTHGEVPAFVSRFTYQRGSEGPTKPTALYDYTVKVPDQKKLVAITLPNAPDVKIAAMTLER